MINISDKNKYCIVSTYDLKHGNTQYNVVEAFQVRTTNKINKITKRYLAVSPSWHKLILLDKSFTKTKNQSTTLNTFISYSEDDAIRLAKEYYISKCKFIRNKIHKLNFQLDTFEKLLNCDYGRA